MEVIEVTEREVEIIEVIERGPQGVAGAAGAVGPVGPAGTTDYNNLTNKPTLGTAASKDVAATGNATSGQVVLGSDTRLTDARTPTSHSHTPSEVGLGNVTNAAQVTSVTGTAPIVSSGGTTPAISISAATTSAAGSMSAADKTKLDAISGTNTGDQTISLTGDVTGSGTGSFAATIANNAVTNAKLAQVATSTLKGRVTASTGNVEDLTATQVRSLLNVADGATANSSDATLLARANHTGTQAASTITGLASIATSGSASDLGSGTVPTARLGSGSASASTFLAGDQSWKAVSGVTTGSVDNAVLRADGTGGSTSQSSNLLVSDFTSQTHPNIAASASVAGFSVTGVSSTDVLTATGHNFIANQMVYFSSITGGSGLATNRPYFVRDISGDTFKVSYDRGGGAVDFSTNITAGTIVSSVGLVLSPQGFGGIMTSVPDGTSTNGNGRNYDSVDLQLYRTAATQVASGIRAALLGGETNTASGNYSAVCGGYSTCTASGAAAFIGGGAANTASGGQAGCLAGNQGTASGTTSATLGGFQNQATADNALAYGRSAKADRYSISAHGNIAFAAIGDSQRIRAVLRCKTTTNTAVEMALDGGTTYLTIPSGKVLYGEISVVGVKSTGADVALYYIRYAAKNVGGTSSEIFSLVTTDNAAGTSLTITTQDTGDYISIKPVGVSGETWRWVAKADLVEVAYGT